MHEPFIGQWLGPEGIHFVNRLGLRPCGPRGRKNDEAGKKREFKQMSQQQHLAEAKVTERRNKASLEELLRVEEAKKKVVVKKVV